MRLSHVGLLVVRSSAALGAHHNIRAEFMRDFEGAVPFQPWAADIFNQRQAIKLRDNPKQPIRYVQPQASLPDDDLIEYICNENAKPVGR